jgi:hypothetical protein
MSVDEIHIPTGVGDRLLEQMLARSRSDRKITFSVGGQNLFNGIFVALEDSERVAYTRAAISLQDLEHINYILDDMECRLNDYLEEIYNIVDDGDC